MPSLKDMLKDVAKFKDEVLVELAGGEKVSLGDLRGLEKEEKASFLKQQETLAAQQAKFKQDLADLMLAQEKVGEMFAQAQAAGGTADAAAAAVAARAAANADPLAGLENDAVLGPLAKALRAQQAKLDELANKNLKTLTDTIQKMALAYVDDTTAANYEKYVPEAKQAELPLDKVLAHCKANNIFTKTGLPDVRKAVKDLTTQRVAPEDLNKQLADAEEKGRLKGLEEAGKGSRPVFVPRPAGGQGVGGNNQPKPFESIDAALAAAANDPEIWKEWPRA